MPTDFIWTIFLVVHNYEIASKLIQILGDEK
jgi:hypothetical protein